MTQIGTEIRLNNFTIHHMNIFLFRSILASLFERLYVKHQIFIDLFQNYKLLPDHHHHYYLYQNSHNYFFLNFDSRDDLERILETVKVSNFS